MFVESVIWLQNITWQDVGEEKWNTIVWPILWQMGQYTGTRYPLPDSFDLNKEMVIDTECYVLRSI